MKFSFNLIRGINLNFSRRVSYSINKRFISSPCKKNWKYINFGIFILTFGIGYLVSQYVSYTDLAICYLYRKLPIGDERFKNYQASLLERANNLPVTKKFIDEGYVQVFPNRKKNNILVDHILRTPGAISIEPLFFYNPKTKYTIGIYHLGMKVTSYPFIVHGGILATVIEDQMKESIKLVTNGTSPDTKGIEISYKSPTISNQFVIVKTTNIQKLDDSTIVECTLLNESGKRVLVNGKAIFTNK